MKIPQLVIEYLDSSTKQTSVELTYIDGFLCDDCYKIQAKTSLAIPQKSLLVLEDFLIEFASDQLVLVILKAKIRSSNVKNYLNYLCLADHSPQVVQSVQRYKHNQMLKKIEFDDPSQHYIPDNVQFPHAPHLIGFGVKSADKSLEFSKKRTRKKVLESQDDILAALVPEGFDPNYSKPLEIPVQTQEMEDNEVFPNFPEWALVYLSCYLKS